MVGEKYLIDLASSFLTKLDIRQKQVALSVKVLDVNLSDRNSSLKDFGASIDDSFIIGSQGKIKSAFGSYLPVFPSDEDDPPKNPVEKFNNKTFFGLLEASIEEGSTKVLASPTLLLSLSLIHI